MTPEETVVWWGRYRNNGAVYLDCPGGVLPDDTRCQHCKNNIKARTNYAIGLFNEHTLRHDWWCYDCIKTHFYCFHDQQHGSKTQPEVYVPAGAL